MAASLSRSNSGMRRHRISLRLRSTADSASLRGKRNKIMQVIIIILTMCGFISGTDCLVRTNIEVELPGRIRRGGKQMGWIDNIKHWTDGGFQVVDRL